MNFAVIAGFKGEAHGFKKHLAAVFLKGEAVALSGKGIICLHGVAEAAHLVDDGESAVAHCYHLAETAGLKSGGHQQKVSACVDAAAESLAVADIGADLAAMAHFALPHSLFVSAVA